MPVVNLCQQWEIIGGVLIQHVILDDYHLQLFHCKSGIHLNCTFIYQINNTTLSFYLLTAILQVGTWDRSTFDYSMLDAFGFSSLLFFVFVQNSLEDLFSLFFAVVKAIVIRTHDHYTKIDCEVPNVNVQDEALGNTWNADRSPSFSTVLHAWIGVNVIHKHLDVGSFHFSNLLGVSENGYWVHGAH